MIPNKAQHKKNAETLINYYYDPEVMAPVEDYVNYISPGRRAPRRRWSRRDPDCREQPADLPLRRRRWPSPTSSRASTEARRPKYNQAFQALIGG